jgi:acetyltransferase
LLEKFFSPSAVAIIGASDKEGKVGTAILRNLIQSNYQGQIYPINPKYQELFGFKCYQSVLDIPEKVKIDLAVIIIPAPFVPHTLKECGQRGIKAVVIISAGFKEIGGEGAKLELELEKILRQYQIRVIGPNCLGMINTHAYLNITFSANTPLRGNISFFSQSGALCTAILDLAEREGVGFSKFVSLGNRVDVTECELLQVWQHDDETKVVLGYLEGVEKGEKFIEVVREFTQKKPLIILKSGDTSAGSKAASSHTGTLAGSGKAYQSVFKQCGVLRANSIEELYDYGISFAQQPLPSGSKVGVVTNAGGPGIMAVDACEKLGLEVTSFEEKTIKRLKEVLPSASNFYNPVDMLGDAQAEVYEKTLQILSEDSYVDSLLIILTPQAMTPIREIARRIVKVTEGVGKTILGCFLGGARVREGINELKKGNIPNFSSPERAAKVLQGMVTYQNWLKKGTSTFPKLPPLKKQLIKRALQKVSREKRVTLTEGETKEILKTVGFCLPESQIVQTAEEAARVASQIGYPVVLKIASPDILHKSDIGGVRVDLRSEDEVRDAFEAMLVRVKRFFPEAELQGVNVQRYILKGKEVIIGMSRDAQFGPLIMFGLGGVYVEVLKDISFRVAPLSLEDAREMVEEISAYPLLVGIRGEKRVNIEEIVTSLFRVSQLGLTFPEILELDINPLKVSEEGGVVLDARAVIKEK